MVTDMKYVPNPIDTADVELSEELLELTEKLAENVHEQWAKTRMEDGWTYGEHRDDHLKQTPCMVPYSQLPESEKVYDREAATEIIKVLIKMGYQISK